jgi:hypothetical protein
VSWARQLLWHLCLNTKETKTVRKWANYFNSSEGGVVPADLIGVADIGAYQGENKPEGGGLVIEYQPAHSNDKKRIVLAFNESGMWETEPEQPNVAT